MNCSTGHSISLDPDLKVNRSERELGDKGPELGSRSRSCRADGGGEDGDGMETHLPDAQSDIESFGHHDRGFR